MITLQADFDHPNFRKGHQGLTNRRQRVLNRSASLFPGLMYFCIAAAKSPFTVLHYFKTHLKTLHRRKVKWSKFTDKSCVK